MEQRLTFSVHFSECDNESPLSNDDMIPLNVNDTTVTHHTININTTTQNENFKEIMTEILTLMMNRLNSSPSQNEENVVNDEIKNSTLNFQQYRARITSKRGYVSKAVCPICLEELKSNRMWHSPKCGHHFHPKCLQTYLTKKSTQPTCPVCRDCV